MRFHWGHGIFVFYTVFVASLIVVVVKSRTFDNSLVDENYYARDINYQQEYDRRRNSYALTDPVRIERTEAGYALQFPAGKIVSGTLHLYRPSSRLNDRLVDLKVDANGVMQLPLDGMLPGRYEAIVEWSASDVDYYDELDLRIGD